MRCNARSQADRLRTAAGATPSPQGLPKLTALTIVQHTNEAVCLAGVAGPNRRTRGLGIPPKPFSHVPVALDYLHTPLSSSRPQSRSFHWLRR